VERELTRRQLEASRELVDALRASKASADRAARVIIVLTGALVLLTIVLVALTVVLTRSSH
jgi:hypothetical protein